MTAFIGRKEELKKLRDLSRKKSASFIVVRGRRRIGKSRLVEELGRDFDRFYRFEGLAPEAGVTALRYLQKAALPLDRMDDNGLIALALLVAESAPRDKGLIVSLIIRLFHTV